LERQANVAELQSLLTPFPAVQMEAYPVSTLVNSPRNDAPDCIAPLVK
jgi:putative SOS response-associated peptidase YedK